MLAMTGSRCTNLSKLHLITAAMAVFLTNTWAIDHGSTSRALIHAHKSSKHQYYKVAQKPRPPPYVLCVLPNIQVSCAATLIARRQTPLPRYRKGFYWIKVMNGKIILYKTSGFPEYENRNLAIQFLSIFLILKMLSVVWDVFFFRCCLPQ